MRDHRTPEDQHETLQSHLHGLSLKPGPDLLPEEQDEPRDVFL